MRIPLGFAARSALPLKVREFVSYKSHPRLNIRNWRFTVHMLIRAFFLMEAAV